MFVASTWQVLDQLVTLVRGFTFDGLFDLRHRQGSKGVTRPRVAERRVTVRSRSTPAAAAARATPRAVHDLCAADARPMFEACSRDHDPASKTLPRSSVRALPLFQTAEMARETQRTSVLLWPPPARIPGFWAGLARSLAQLRGIQVEI